MPLYEDGKYHEMIIGDFHPVKVMDGDRTIARAKTVEKSGTTLEWSDTYNDKVLSAAVQGASAQTVTVQGKNLFDKNRVTLNKWFDANGNIATSVTGDCIFASPIKVSPNTAYVFSGVSTTTVFWGEYDASFGWIKRSTGYVLTTGASTAYLRCYFKQEYLNTAQLELGSTATPYTPFVPNSPSPDYPATITSINGINLSVHGNAGQMFSAHRNVILRSLPDGTRDEWNVLTGANPRNVGVKVFDGTEDWFYCSGNCFYTTPSYTNIPSMLCSHYIFSTARSVTGLADKRIILTSSSNGNYFLIKDTTITTAVDIKSQVAAEYAAGTPVTIYYALATPVTETVDPIPLPTYPRYTALECTAPITASVRVVDKGV